MYLPNRVYASLGGSDTEAEEGAGTEREMASPAVSVSATEKIREAGGGAGVPLSANSSPRATATPAVSNVALLASVSGRTPPPLAHLLCPNS